MRDRQPLCHVASELGCGPLRRERGTIVALLSLARACRPPPLTPHTHAPPQNNAPKKQNRRNTPERLEIKKFNPNLRRYTLHREIK